MIKTLITRAKNNHLIKSSAIFFTGSIAASFGSYLFHLFMGRMLSVVEYGELQSLVSIFMIIFLPASALTLVVAKYSSHHSTTDELGKIKFLLKVLSKKFAYVGVGFSLILILLSGQIAAYLRIVEPLKVVTISVIFVFTFLQSINNGILQGLQKFKALSLVAILGAANKLLFGLLLVYIGWQVYGAIGAFVISSLISYVYSFYLLKKVLAQTSELNFDSQEFKELARYAIPVLFSLLCITLFLSMDVILAKHYFAPELAGAYGGISILGRIIFFATGPMVAVLFPISAKQFKEGENYHKSFLLSLSIISAIGGAAILAYFTFPQIIIHLLLGSKYLYIAGYLGWYAIAITLLSLINLIVNFLLSIKMTKCVYWVLVGVILQFIGITIWHDNIKQLILVINTVMLVILVGLFYYYYWASHRQLKVSAKSGFAFGRTDFKINSN
jgi:O-antigen/teichoic acid export membrane protein